MIPIAAALLSAAGCGSLEVRMEYDATDSDTAALPTVATQTATRAVSPSPSATASAARTEPAPGIPSAIAVDAGQSHTCAVMESGVVMCWGSNEYGQLGNGSRINSLVPVEVEGLPDAIAVAAGWKHTCALTAGGAVFCWGYNQYGELGNGGTEASETPVAVYGLTAGVIRIEAGDDHTCAVTDQYEAYCWGYNAYGQLGDGTSVSRSNPAGIKGVMDGVANVAAGWGHTCVLTVNGSVKCWGSNIYGQLGNGDTAEYHAAAVEVAGLARSAVKVHAGGGQSCALTIYGGVRCWGNNKYGQLGGGTAESGRTPVAVTGLKPNPRDVAAGWNHACVVDAGGGLICWGWNFYGQLGDGTKASRSAPAGVYGLSAGVKSAGLGWAHSCAVEETGAVKCWGLNESGQLGDGSNIDSQVPIPAVGLVGVLPPPADVPTFTATYAPPTETGTPAPETPTKTHAP